MDRNKLSTFFEGISIKKLSEVEINPVKSNQHEFNGVAGLKKILGRDRKTFSAKFIYLDDNETIAADGSLTWYDARVDHPSRSEYRLYYTGNEVLEKANINDSLIIIKLKDESVLVLIVKENTTIENQIIWLFKLDHISDKFQIQDFDEKDIQLGFGERLILSELGIETNIEEQNYLDLIFDKFGETYPDTKDFSLFAREIFGTVSVSDNSDEVLVGWMEQEEKLFFTLEKYIVSKKLEIGFHGVEDFLSYSLSTHNRRKSRAGYALEHHLKAIFNLHHIKYSKGKQTENKAQPDFIFPDIRKYHDDSFPVNKLTMLGVKTSCKDRWRQVLAEARRIEHKHLFTLQTAISENQTNQMEKHDVQLVIPKVLHDTYSEKQKDWLMDLNTFIELVKEKQNQ